MGLNGKSVGELGDGFDFGELLEAVRAAATPEEEVSANEAISVVITRLRSNRTPIRSDSMPTAPPPTFMPSRLRVYGSTCS